MEVDLKDLLFKIIAAIISGLFLLYFKRLVSSIGDLNNNMAIVLTHLENHKEAIVETKETLKEHGTRISHLEGAING